MSIRSDLVCQTGRIESLEGYRAFVRIEQPAECETCAGRSGCHALSGEGRLIEVLNEVGATVGQRVELGLRPAAVVTASFLMFILPALAFLLGIAIGYLFAESQGWPSQQWIGLITGAFAFCLVLVVLRLLSPRFHHSKKYEPVITRVLENTIEADIMNRL